MQFFDYARRFLLELPALALRIGYPLLSPRIGAQIYAFARITRNCRFSSERMKSGKLLQEGRRLPEGSRPTIRQIPLFPAPEVGKRCAEKRHGLVGGDVACFGHERGGVLDEVV